MSNKLIKLSYFVLIFVLMLSPASLGFSKSSLVQKVKANRCLSVFSKKINKQQGQAEWHIYADNKCDDYVKLGKEIKITVARNVSLKRGTILNTRDFIVPPKAKKLIFMAFVLNPTKKSRLKWVLKK